MRFEGVFKHYCSILFECGVSSRYFGSIGFIGDNNHFKLVKATPVPSNNSISFDFNLVAERIFKTHIHSGCSLQDDIIVLSDEIGRVRIFNVSENLESGFSLRPH